MPVAVVVEAAGMGKRLAQPQVAEAREARMDRTMAQTPSPIPVAVAEEGQRPLLEQNHGAAGAAPAS
jgi:hypothetical protein